MSRIQSVTIDVSCWCPVEAWKTDVDEKLDERVPTLCKGWDTRISKYKRETIGRCGTATTRGIVEVRG